MKTSTATIAAGIVLIAVCLYGGFVPQDDCGPAFAVTNSAECQETHPTPTGLLVLGILGVGLLITGVILRRR